MKILMIRPRTLLAAMLLAAPALLVGHAASAEDSTLKITIKDHKFSPDEIRVQAGKAVVLQIKNEDSTAEEFESHELKVEKVIAGGKEGTVRLKPLKAGRYPFVGEYHESTAKGVVIAE
ncbi:MULTISPECIES: cupredoxin domain-containing protein [Rhodomicrobium]|uniref:cupredoxin domain-containing protein n=1 Tax=Rhodomicrobium TaxID=1068 RepID=UPI001FDA3072|nr:MULTISPECIES: cupredoxin domain-containing protein [Rhodomicrobium]